MKKILVFGGSGLVGSKFIDLNKHNFEITAPNADEVDILNSDQILKAAEKLKPSTIINFAAYTNVEQAQAQNGDQNNICFQINSIGAKNAAQAAKDLNSQLIHISTEYVFDGTKSDGPYIESDKTNPINWYGQTKLFGEENVMKVGGRSLIVRISMPYSAFYEIKKDVARFFLQELKNKKTIKAIEDQFITPTLVDDIASALKIFIEKNTSGLYHVSCKDNTTPLEFAKKIAEIFNLDLSLISPLDLVEYNTTKTAKLLKYSWLNPAKFETEFGNQTLHTVFESLQIFKQTVDAEGEI